MNELEIWRKENGQGTVLQYVDDILIAAESREITVYVPHMVVTVLEQTGGVGCPSAIC